MDKSGISFLILMLIISLFGCSTDKVGLKTYVVEENKVHVAWDPVPKHANIAEDSEIKYCVYICKSKSKDKKEAVPVKKTVNSTEFKAVTPIPDTSCVIEFSPKEDEFVIGVQTVISEKEEIVVCDPAIKNDNRSGIAWSDSTVFTNYHPFDVKYGAK